MSWIQKLYETYENSQSAIGVETDDNTVPLLPICHTTQMAQIEIVLDGKGNFKRARVVPKEEARTIIPCTEASGGRTSGPVAHPLFDKLQYVAGDYKEYGGKKESQFNLYLKQLEDWCSSPFSDPKLKAVLSYVKKGRVIKDLVKHKVLFLDKKGKLLPKPTKQKGVEFPKIFEVLNSQDEAFIRWEVEIPGDPNSKLWKDAVLRQKWIQFYSSAKTEKTLCYVTGEMSLMADQHPAKIRNDGDKAKLIASGKSRSKGGKIRVDDNCGFTFLGRFRSADEANGVGLETTQKAHAALRWLISRQGYRKGDQAVVAWATSGKDIPQPTADPLFILGIDEVPPADDSLVSTAQEVGIRLRKRIAGYSIDLGDSDKVVVIALDSASPGRMSITFYRELTGSEYLERIDNWHNTCTWLHTYLFREIPADAEQKKKFIRVAFGAPAPNDIAEAAYGQKVDDRLKKATVERLLPCIVDAQPIPRDIVESAVRRASNRVAMEDWEWEKTLSIACALYKKFKEKENYTMALDPNRRTRDYLYGRLLALADSLEQWALNKANEDRPTTAARLMNRFAERPFSTWRTIELALSPYKARLGGVSKKRQRLIDEVKDQFNPDDFTNDKPLSGEFLLGYSSQREYLRNNKDKFQEDEQEN